MDINECKGKLIDIFTDMGAMVPYEPTDLPDDWQELSDYVADLASTLGRCVTRLASYSAIASRKAKG
jgi:hypothetical protein